MSSKNKQNAAESGRVYWIRIQVRGMRTGKSEHAAARAALQAAYRTPGVDFADMIENGELVKLAADSVTDAIQSLNESEAFEMEVPHA